MTEHLIMALPAATLGIKPHTVKIHLTGNLQKSLWRTQPNGTSRCFDCFDRSIEEFLVKLSRRQTRAGELARFLERFVNLTAETVLVRFLYRRSGAHGKPRENPSIRNNRKSPYYLTVTATVCKERCPAPDAHIMGHVAPDRRLRLEPKLTGNQLSSFFNR